ncbi:MAG: copper amine oxidase [Clostridia bacterium]|nr:copper amine oxidase [Clostridia bacterium]
MKQGARRKYLIFPFIMFLVIGLAVFLSPKLLVAQADADDVEAILQERLKEAIVLFTGSPLALVNNTESQVDEANAEICPYTKEGRVFVPLRFLAESLQAKVVWDAQTSAVTLTTKNKTVRFTVGIPKILIDNHELAIYCAPEIINDRTFVPVRAINEALGKKVFYDRGLIVISEKENSFHPETEKTLLDALIAKVNNLPKIGSEEQLRNLLAGISPDNYYRSGDIGLDVAEAESGLQTATNGLAAKTRLSESAQAVDYSETNVQVAGVDEADLVKTDGEYIYQVNKDRVIILKAYPAAEMEVVSVLDFTKEDFQPLELYVDEKNLVVIGSRQHKYYYLDQPMVQDSAGVPEVKLQTQVVEIWPPRYTKSRVKAIIYDLQDKSNLTKLREVEIDGNYLSSRKIGSYLYLVANDPINYYRYPDYPVIMEKGVENTQATENSGGAVSTLEEAGLTPSYRDTAIQEESIPVSCRDIRYIPPLVEPNYLIIVGLDLAKNEQPAQVSTYLGAGQNIYVSQDNFYIALRKYNYLPLVQDTLVQGTAAKRLLPRQVRDTTLVYKFSLDKGKVTYLTKGEVPGTLLNQFSMDENREYLRIATTTGSTWGTGQNMSQNNVYVLDESMSIVGRIENIAPGERIYSARFMGDRAYLVTFKNTDPLFVLDLKKPTEPKILGALKIPGYSDYLHPYDENHLIGFGKDTIEIENKNAQGEVVSTQAYYQGMKLALFDVSDVHNPQELYKEIIGDRGTESELLRNHKALLFDKEKELLAFPVTVMKIPAEQKEKDANAIMYGQFAYQGAYIYQLNLKDGFTLRGRITHLSEEDLLKAGYRSYNRENEVKRILYIGDTLYTLSDGMVKAHGLVDLVERKAVQLP